MTPIPSHYYRQKAASELGAKGVYPKQGTLHGLMYGVTFSAGLTIGGGLDLSSWASMVPGLIALAIGWFWGVSVDGAYDKAVAELAGEMEAKSR